MKIIWVFLLLLVSSSSYANEETPSLVTVNATIDLQGIEQSAKKSAQAISEMATSLSVIADNPNLSTEQKQQISDTIDNINHLIAISSGSLESLPTFLNTSKNTLSTHTSAFFNDVKFNVILVLSFIVIALIIIIICFYWFMLRPLQNTLLQATTNISTMAKAIEHSATSLELTNKNHTKLVQLLSTNNNANQSKL